MKICVFGMFHLGLVTAACLSDKDKNNCVVGLDPSKELTDNLQKTKLSIYEPDLEEKIQTNKFCERLIFTSDYERAIKNTDVVWITFDTPVSDDDVADSEYVVNQVKSIFSYLNTNTVVLISSQLPVGTTRNIQEDYNNKYPDRNVTFAYVPENLRLGTAINSFTKPERIIVGTEQKEVRPDVILTISNVLKPFCNYYKIIWMNFESAEMSKHALNAFLATSITFANEVATICESVGADYKDVEKALRTDSRIGNKSYIKAGASYSGGTLARDIDYLSKSGSFVQKYLLRGVKESNHHHKAWVIRKLHEHFGVLNQKNKTVAILGLTYKTNTNTLRRSGPLELCQYLLGRGMNIKCHDPTVKELPIEFRNKKIQLFGTVSETIEDVDAIVIMTEHDVYKQLTPDSIINTNDGNPIIIDPNRFLEYTLGNDCRFKYYTVGRSENVIKK